MDIEPRIELIQEKKLVGKKMRTSISDIKYKVPELWKGFIPETVNISRKLKHDHISMSIYDPDYFTKFNPEREYEKWAAVEVEDFESVPEDMETHLLAAGLYAVFHYKGLNTDNSIFQYIFQKWLPDSGFSLDNRPHFEVLGDKYRNNDPFSEEDIYIPVKSL